MSSEKFHIILTVGIIVAMAVAGLGIIAYNIADDHPHEVPITASIDAVYTYPDHTEIDLTFDTSSYCYIYFETRDGSMHYLISADVGHHHHSIRVDGVYSDADIIRIRAYDRML